jgi:hypothetical protein
MICVVQDIPLERRAGRIGHAGGGEDLSKVVAVGGAGRASERAGDANRRIELRLGNADLGALRHRKKFGGPDVGPPAQEIRRDSNSNRARRGRDLSEGTLAEC